MTAAIAEAQAASVVKLGPLRSSMFATLPATTLASSPGMVSSSTLGAPSSNEVLNLEKASSDIPASFACLWYLSISTLSVDRVRFSPPSAFAKTTPVFSLGKSEVAPSPRYPASSNAAADTLTAHC